jgi:hypothetical protein
MESPQEKLARMETIIQHLRPVEVEYVIDNAVRSIQVQNHAFVTAEAMRERETLNPQALRSFEQQRKRIREVPKTLEEEQQSGEISLRKKKEIEGEQKYFVEMGEISAAEEELSHQMSDALSLYSTEEFPGIELFAHLAKNNYWGTDAETYGSADLSADALAAYIYFRDAYFQLLELIEEEKQLKLQNPLLVAELPEMVDRVVDRINPKAVKKRLTNALLKVAKEEDRNLIVKSTRAKNTIQKLGKMSEARISSRRLLLTHDTPVTGYLDQPRIGEIVAALEHPPQQLIPYVTPEVAMTMVEQQPKPKRVFNPATASLEVIIPQEVTRTYEHPHPLNLISSQVGPEFETGVVGEIPKPSFAKFADLRSDIVPPRVDPVQWKSLFSIPSSIIEEEENVYDALTIHYYDEVYNDYAPLDRLKKSVKDAERETHLIEKLEDLTTEEQKLYQKIYEDIRKVGAWLVKTEECNAKYYAYDEVIKLRAGPPPPPESRTVPPPIPPKPKKGTKIHHRQTHAENPPQAPTPSSLPQQPTSSIPQPTASSNPQETQGNPVVSDVREGETLGERFAREAKEERKNETGRKKPQGKPAAPRPPTGASRPQNVPQPRQVHVKQEPGTQRESDTVQVPRQLYDALRYQLEQCDEERIQLRNRGGPQPSPYYPQPTYPPFAPQYQQPNLRAYQEPVGPPAPRVFYQPPIPSRFYRAPNFYQPPPPVYQPPTASPMYKPQARVVPPSSHKRKSFHQMLKNRH